MNAVFATGRNEVQRTLRRRMAITYNDLFLDIRRELKQGGVIDTTLEARELIKGRVLENSMYTAREAAEELKVAARCEVVQVIGSKFVLFRYQHNKDKRKIELEKDRKRSV